MNFLSKFFGQLQARLLASAFKGAAEFYSGFERPPLERIKFPLHQKTFTPPTRETREDIIQKALATRLGSLLRNNINETGAAISARLLLWSLKHEDSADGTRTEIENIVAEKIHLLWIANARDLAISVTDDFEKYKEGKPWPKLKGRVVLTDEMFKELVAIDPEYFSRIACQVEAIPKSYTPTL